MLFVWHSNTTEGTGVEQSQLWFQAFQSVENDVAPQQMIFFPPSLYNTEIKVLSSTHDCVLWPHAFLYLLQQITSSGQ